MYYNIIIIDFQDFSGSKVPLSGGQSQKILVI